MNIYDIAEKAAFWRVEKRDYRHIVFVIGQILYRNVVPAMAESSQIAVRNPRKNSVY